MAKYAYHAVFTQEETGWSVNFPDIDGCFTCGDTLPDANVDGGGRPVSV